MSDIAHFFKPIKKEDISGDKNYHENQFGQNFKIYSDENDFPDLDGIDMAVIGVCEDRQAIENKASAHAPDQVRRYLYNLFPGSFSARIADLGNIQAGFEVED